MTSKFEDYLTELFDYYINFESNSKITRFLQDANDRSRFSRQRGGYGVYDHALYGVAAAGQPQTDTPSPVLKEKDTRIGL